MRYLNPKPDEIFLDVGSGDGRVAIAAAKNYGCQSIGIEIDPNRIALAQQNALNEGVSDRVSFIQGDFNKLAWPKADVAYVYLFSEDLQLIKNKLLSVDRFASFAHQVPNLNMYQHNNQEFYTWDYNKVFTWYGNRMYTGAPCSRANCSMCNSIRYELAQQKAFHQQ